MSLEIKSILLVEDDEDDVFALRWALKKAQITLPLQVVDDGQQAIDYLAGAGKFADREQYPMPDLVLLDLKLPYRNGIEVLGWIRSQENLQGLPVIILSGSDEARDHERAQALGACGYLVKPPMPEQMAQLLAPGGLTPPHP